MSSKSHLAQNSLEVPSKLFATKKSTLGKTIELTTVHALAWLAVANAVGVLLAGLLVFPELSSLFGPLTFGRWVPLHLDLQLYGWCSLPLVAFLFKVYLPKSRDLGSVPSLAVFAWSGSLLFASLSWLMGDSSGKLFLEWKGASRLLFPAALFFLAVVLLLGFITKLRTEEGSLKSRLLQAILLQSLFGVPFVLYWAASPAVYPAYNPDSGGATGTSLLGSTLGIVLLFCLIPILGGAKRRFGDRLIGSTFGILGVHFLVFALLDHGHASNHDPGQILGLASLLIWWPLLLRYYRSFHWPASSVRWLVAFACWAGFLLVTALVTFLPGVLGSFKFTNALVAHAHLAMAGMVTCFNVSLLILINRETRLRATFDGKLGFWLWQIGLAVMVIVLLTLGTLEGIDPGRLFRPDPAAEVIYALRLLAGLAMWTASCFWLSSALRARAHQPGEVAAQQPAKTSLGEEAHVLV